MKTLKYGILSIIISLTFSVCSAQNKSSVDEKSSKMTEKLTKEVKLSKEQQEKVKVIYTDYINKKKALEKKLKKLKKEKNTTINQILTEEQRQLKASKKKKKK